MSEPDTHLRHTHMHTLSALCLRLLMLACVSPSLLSIFGPHLASGDFFSFLRLFYWESAFLIAGMLEAGP